MSSANHTLRACGLIAALMIACVDSLQAAVTEITPDMLYSEAVQVEKEVELLKHFYHITASYPVTPVEADLKPNHVWQKAYAIQLKLNIFRRKLGLVGFVPVTREPMLKMSTSWVWGQIQRTLTEVKIIKAYLGIPGEPSPAKPVHGKRLIDVFNKLNQISYETDTLNGESINPSYVYAEVIRLNEDVNSLLRITGTADTAVPPVRKSNAIAKDSLAAVFFLLVEIQRLQRQLGIDTTDFGAFYKTDNVTSADVFNMVMLCLSELDLVKAQLGMKHAFTVPAEFHAGKTPDEVVQLLGYVNNKLRLIQVR